MKYLKKYFDLFEKNTDEYNPPDNVVKIPDNDTGFNLVKKNYRRFIWTWNKYNDKNKPKK